ncbi:MAG TPA: chemotaxis protein CheD [Acidocella sp.]|nr:MAG: chemotaxis protein CheD [Rhodospirillales bacterium 20-64-7]HQT46773.1 chemotaxis protein CheD [Acidocella sp.]
MSAAGSNWPPQSDRCRHGEAPLDKTLEQYRRINIVQGEQHVDSNPDVVLTTLLGSCVAACIWDSEAGVGGMNHFLLPGGERDARESAGASMRYGVYAMELLVNGLLRKGAQRGRLQAKVFGGACMMQGLTDVGELNAAFTERFLRAENIPLIGGSLRGSHGRRIQFWPSSGRARQAFLKHEPKAIFQEERDAALQKSPGNAGLVELF